MFVQTVCGVCGPGTYAPGYGNGVCLPCPQGHYNSLNGSSNCLPADSGYIPAPDQKSQVGCQAIFFTKFFFLEFAFSRYNLICCLSWKVACQPGSYSNGTGNWNCTPCAAGSATNALHSQYCPLCSSGHFASGTGNVGVVGGLVECLSVCCVL